MSSVTIFEGADGAGKTTLIEALGSHYTIEVANHGPYPNENAISWHYLASLKTARHSRVFMDRSWLAEPVYGSAYRLGLDRVGAASRRMLDRVALSLGGVVVRCAPPFERCAEAFAKRKALHGEYLDDTKQLLAVYQGYLRDLKTDLPVVDFDYTTTNAGDLWKFVRAVRPLVNLGPGIGRWAPGAVTLLVGDRMNARPDARDWDLPFVSFNADGSSAWLAIELERANVSESSLYWVNAYAPDGQPTDMSFVGDLRPKRIVALGGAAAGVCNNAGLRYCSEAHPQFWMRARSDTPYPLIGLLQEVL